MKKIIICSLLVLLLLQGCSKSAKYDLPAEPIKFETYDYFNPQNKDDGYRAFSYNGRVYIPYGTQGKAVRSGDIGQCLGYIIQDGEADTDMRVYTLFEDESENYLMVLQSGGEMAQADFLRAEDTADKEIKTPDYIESLSYDLWK